MPTFLRLITVLATLGLVAACANIDDVEKMGVKGGAFEKGLHKEYIKLAKSEDSQDDWGSADLYAERAKMAAMGTAGAPEMLSARDLHKKYIKDLTNGRERLVTALGKGGAQKAPNHAAVAQTSFECWMEQAEENLQKKDIAACRNNFYGAMALLEDAVWPTPRMAKKAKKKGPPRTKHFLVFFDLDSAKVAGGEAKAVAAAAKFAKSNKGSNVYVTGHADQSGSKQYNMKLAKKRTDEVVKGLTGMGVNKRGIGAVVQGENDPAVSRSGKQDARNRRVVISVIY